MDQKIQCLALFPFEKKLFSFSTTATFSCHDGTLDVSFVVTGRMDDIVFPVQSVSPTRQDNLWKHTCFEVFLSPAGQNAYWEFNLSPSGDWACYRFSAFRKDMSIEYRVSNIVIEKKQFSDSKKWSAGIPLKMIPGLCGAEHMDCGLTAVIETNDGHKNHWALSHHGSKPDFHLRESFNLCIVPH